MTSPQSRQAAGALVISLDFEMRWGVRDRYPLDGGAYRANLLGARAAIPRLLDLFAAYGIHATWATVGLMMAETRADMERFRPARLPAYENTALDPYQDAVGENEAADPLHFAASLIAQIRARADQEIASHTFGHYYPLEPRLDPESFRADLASAVAIAQAHGLTLRSLVFPRNQINYDYAAIIADAGFTNCRANARGWLYHESNSAHYFRQDIRAGRLLDNYLPLTGRQVIAWNAIPFAGPLCCLPASHFLRPISPRLRHLEPLRFRRIAAGIETAARTGGLYHLWWHPHNMGIHTDEYLAFLERLLTVFARCRERDGMASLTMAEAAEIAVAVRAGTR